MKKSTSNYYKFTDAYNYFIKMYLNHNYMKLGFFSPNKPVIGQLLKAMLYGECPNNCYLACLYLCIVFTMWFITASCYQMLLH